MAIRQIIIREKSLIRVYTAKSPRATRNRGPKVATGQRAREKVRLKARHSYNGRKVMRRCWANAAGAGLAAVHTCRSRATECVRLGPFLDHLLPELLACVSPSVRFAKTRRARIARTIQTSVASRPYGAPVFTPVRAASPHLRPRNPQLCRSNTPLRCTDRASCASTPAADTRHAKSASPEQTASASRASSRSARRHTASPSRIHSRTPSIKQHRTQTRTAPAAPPLQTPRK